MIGAAHDFGALVLSVRARGLSIGAIAEGLMGRRAKSLMHAIIFFAIALAMGVFAYVVGLLFSADYYPESVVPSAVILVLALIIGSLVRSSRGRLLPLIAVAFVWWLLFRSKIGFAFRASGANPDACFWGFSFLFSSLVSCFFLYYIPVWVNFPGFLLMHHTGR